MTIELLQTLSIVAYIVAGVLLLLSIALFFLLEVPKLFGDLTGSNAKKAIENIRRQNEKGDIKAYHPNSANASSGGKITGKIGKSVNAQNNGGASRQTGKINTSKISRSSSETTVLGAANTAPSASETTVLGGAANGGTTVIGGMPHGGETTVLSQGQIMNYETQASYGEGLSVIVEMGFIGSSEIIE